MSKPEPKEIKRLLTGFRERRDEADRELERADDELCSYKRTKVLEEHKRTGKSKGEIVLELYEDKSDFHLNHLKYMRKRAVGNLTDIKRRVKLLKGALRTVEGSR